MYHFYLTHPSICGHLDGVHILAAINSATVNTGVCVPFHIMFFSGFKPRSGIAGSGL